MNRLRAGNAARANALPVTSREKGHTMKFITYLINWLFAREVLDAINNGASYEEVEQIAHREDAR